LLQGFAYVGLFAIVAIGFALVTIILPIFLRIIKIIPSKPNAVKNATFECGMPTIGKTWVRFNFRYYFYALIFLVLDIFIVFLYPWAASLKDTTDLATNTIVPGLGLPAFIIMLIFMAIMVVGFVYAWKKKVLEWK
jgi:NADH-quinone oxidoreductase subunit A